MPTALWWFFIRDARVVVVVPAGGGALSAAPVHRDSEPTRPQPPEAPMVSEQLVDLSRLQFAATALYHFLFVPLTIGMTWILVIMESVYVMTGKPIWT